MKALQVVQVYHHDPHDKGKGGVVRYLNNLLKYLSQKDVRVILLGVDIFKCQRDSQDILFIPIVKDSNAWWKYLVNLTLKLPIIEIPKNAIIHIHRIEYVLPFIIWKKRNPIILTLHGERLATAKSICSKKAFFLFINFIYKILEYFAFKRANVIVAVSNRVKASFEKVHKNISNKVVVLPVGVDLDEFKPMDKSHLREKYGIDKKAKVILFAGVLEDRKNVKLLIKAFKHVHKLYPNSILIITGTGPNRHSLETLARRLGIDSKVRFLGEVPLEHLPEIYNIADIFALPSLSEGSPTVVREALACGIPVVSTNVGDVSEIITDPLLGVIVDTYTDERVFAEALIKTIENIDKNNEEIKKRCRDIARKYSFENVVEKYIEIYQELLRGKKTNMGKN